MQPLLTIAPIFILIALGWFAHHRGFIPPEFLGPANRLTYYFAIPAMVFHAIAQASLKQDFNAKVLLITLGAAAIAYASAWVYCRLVHIPRHHTGSLIQSAGHGNLGYIGLPFALYALGDAGLVKAGIISGFLMILQNVISTTALQTYAPSGENSATPRSLFKQLLGNPVIIASLLGISVSALDIALPQVLQRTLDLLGGLASPMALLLIGASISFPAMRKSLRLVLSSLLIKLLLLPTIGLALYLFFGLPAADFLPGLILLASPTATVAYIMAKELGGDTDFVVAAISASTLLSALSFFFWLSMTTYFFS